MPKRISLFNHKGGVSKTTTTFHLGWLLAERGHTVVMVDADPQCSLTGLVMDCGVGEDLGTFYERHPDRNIHAALKPAFESRPELIRPVECIPAPGRPGLFLLPGHVNLSEYEVTLGIAQELSGSIQALQNLPGAFSYLLEETAIAQQADFILVDMSPSLTSINENLLMTSDYFIVPAAPDYFSVMAIRSLAEVLPRWASWADKAAKLNLLRDAAYPFPYRTPLFMGSIIQKLRPRQGRAAAGFQRWIDDVNEAVAQRLYPVLAAKGLTFDRSQYEDLGLLADSLCLAEVPDFNTLFAASQTHRTPVFALTDEMFGHTGQVLVEDRRKADEFKAVFGAIADRLLALVNHA